MDIIKEIGNNDRYSLHTHTQFCDGHAPMHEFVDEALAKGFAVLGFTPHSPVPASVPYGEFGALAGLPPCNMSFESVPLYLQEAERLKRENPGVNILTGMEVEYLGDAWGPTHSYFKQLTLDYTIGSVHFVPSFDGRYIDIDGRYDSFERKMALDFDGDIRYVTETFFSQSQKMVAAGGFDIIGHFDKIKGNGALYYPALESEPWYDALVNDLIDSIVAAHLIVEINTKAWEGKRMLFPGQRYWKRLIQEGVPIIVNADAHRPTLLNASRVETLRALDYLRSKMK